MIVVIVVVVVKVRLAVVRVSERICLCWHLIEIVESLSFLFIKVAVIRVVELVRLIAKSVVFIGIGRL